MDEIDIWLEKFKKAHKNAQTIIDLNISYRIMIIA